MSKNYLVPKEGFNEILLYTTPNGKVKVEIYLQNETIWLTQQKIAELFGVDRSVVTKHLKNIFESKELEQNSVSAKIVHTAADGKNYSTWFYNLDVIISVGYRVNSTQATHFRIWATERLKEYIIKGKNLIYPSASSKSEIKSATFSMPTDKRIIVSRIPAAFLSFSVNSA